MTSKLINIRVPKELYDQVNLFTNKLGYTSTQEFARESLRQFILIQKKIEIIESFRGGIKNIPQKNEKDVRKRVFKELLKEIKN